MKKTILFTILALLGITQAVAQEYEYVPFVREGVKWVYDCGGFESLEFQGDTVINGKTYKAMHVALNTENDRVAGYFRDEGKVVYGIVPDGQTTCPIICMGSPAFDELLYSGQEFILYDFNDPYSYYSEIRNPNWWEKVYYYFNDTITVNGKGVGRHALSYQTDFCIIEGIGYDGNSAYGYPLAYQYPILCGDGIGYYTATPSLHCVIENGDTIYKSMMALPDKRDVLSFAREGVKWVNERVVVNHGDTTRNYYSYKFDGKPEGSNWPSRYAYVCHYFEGGSYHEETDSVIAFCLDYPSHSYGTYHDLLCYDNYAADMITEKGLNLIDYSYTPLRPDLEPYNVGVDLLRLYAFDEYDITTHNTVYNYIDKQTEPFLNRHNFIQVEPLTIEGMTCLRYAYLGEDGDTLAYVVEGIGFDSRDMGDLLTPFTRRPDPSADYQECCGLCHVVKDGKVIYKGMRYSPDNMTGLDEVVADKVARPQDDYYYDLMGRRMGTEVPQAPGIYIHHGNKIVVR